MCMYVNMYVYIYIYRINSWYTHQEYLPIYLANMSMFPTESGVGIIPQDFSKALRLSILSSSSRRISATHRWWWDEGSNFAPPAGRAFPMRDPTWIKSTRYPGLIGNAFHKKKNMVKTWVYDFLIHVIMLLVECFNKFLCSVQEIYVCICDNGDPSVSYKPSLLCIQKYGITQMIPEQIPLAVPPTDSHIRTSCMYTCVYIYIYTHTR